MPLSELLFSVEASTNVKRLAEADEANAAKLAELYVIVDEHFNRKTLERLPVLSQLDDTIRWWRLYDFTVFVKLGNPTTWVLHVEYTPDQYTYDIAAVRAHEIARVVGG